jgi:hypothetical protein
MSMGTVVGMGRGTGSGSGGMGEECEGPPKGLDRCDFDTVLFRKSRRTFKTR